jgi:hypothetical protein
VVDLVGDEASHPALEGRDHPFPVQPDVLDAQPQRAYYQATDVEEGQAPLVLLVGLGRLVDDTRIEQHHRIGAAFGWAYDSGRLDEPELRRRETDALVEDVQLVDLLQRGDQPVDDFARRRLLAR